jgi:hypothetical protein
VSTEQFTRCDLHPQEAALLTCGGCGKRICTICMTLTGEGPRCQDCMARLNAGSAPAPTVQGVVIPAGEEAARTDAAREAYYATETPVVYCARHPKTETLLRCGRCDTPICPRCMVHAGVGIRCPDCAANPQRTVGEKVEQEVAAARGRPAPPRDTGFRNYWHKNQVYQKVLPQHYVLAALAGFGVALVLGLVWGFTLNGNLMPFGFDSGSLTESRMLTNLRAGNTLWAAMMDQSIRETVHLLPELALGIIIAEVISRATQSRVGPGLQVIGGLSVVFAILVCTMTVGARLFQNATGQFPAFDQLFIQSIAAIGQQFNGNGIGILIFWALGVVFAVIRLKR